MEMLVPPLKYRTIELDQDFPLAFEHYKGASIATFGETSRVRPEDYRPWLQDRVEEFPDGCVLVYWDKHVVGQLELQVPYGLTTGYVNLFYVRPEHRGRGFGKMLHQYVERYFSAWEADLIHLDVAPQNLQAVRFYEAIGYRFTGDAGETEGTQRMYKRVG